MFQKQTSLERQLQRITNDLERARKEYNDFKEELSRREMTLQICQKQLEEVKAELDKAANKRFLETDEPDNKKKVRARLWKRKKDAATPQSTFSEPLPHVLCHTTEAWENGWDRYLPLFSFYILVVTFVCCVLFSGWIKRFM